MNPQVFSLFLIAAFAIGLSFAGSRGHSMPLPVILTLVIVGPRVVLAPTILRVVAGFGDRLPQITEDEQVTCWILGGVMTMVAIVASIIPKKKN